MKKSLILIMLTMIFSFVMAAQYDYTPTDSPGQYDYDSDTYTELGWTDIVVTQTDIISGVQIAYTWTTDNWASEGSFHIESPNGTSTEIASGQSSGTYNVTLTDFNGEAMNGTWKLWVADSYSDGGHQATSITVSFLYEVAGTPEPASNPAPANLATNVPLDGNLTWDFGTDTDSYDLWFGPAGNMSEVVTGATAEPGGTGSFVYSGLDVLTSYTWRVVSHNTASGLYTEGPLWSFYSEGQPISEFPYTEDFDGDWVGEPATPWGWTVVNADNDSYLWSPSAQYITPHSGSFTAHGMGNEDDYLITPPMNLTDIDARLIWWDVVESSSYANSYKVLLSTTDTQISSFTEELGDFTCTNTTWTEHIVNLDDYNGQTVYIAFYQYSSASTYYGFGIDDVLIEEMPSTPIFSITPDVDTWDFGALQINTTASKTFTIQNTGGGTLVISTVSTNGEYFSISEYPTDMNLDAGESTDFIVQYAPTTTGEHTGTMTITDGRAETNISLLGSCFDPTIYVLPWTEGFDTYLPPNWTEMSGIFPAASGTSSNWTQDDWLNDSSSGNQAAKVNIYSTSTDEWLITPPIVIPAGDYELRFDLGLTDFASSIPIEDPTAQEDDKFIVAISDTPSMANPSVLRQWDNAGSDFVYNQIPNTGETVTIDLSAHSGTKYIAFYGESTATGGDNDLFVDNVTVRETPTEPIFAIDPEAKDFGRVPLNETTDATFTISNTGGVNLVIEEGRISLEGTDADQFGLGEITYPMTVTPGGNASFTVSFAPTTVGSKSATLQIVDNIGTKALHTVALTGQGVILNTVPYAEAFADGWGDWIVVNGEETNKWFVGDPDAPATKGQFGTNAAFISNDEGTTWAYTVNATSVVHFYQDFAFPAEATDFKLKFDWQCEGEGGYTNYDYLSVFVVDTAVVPQTGTQLSGQLGTYLESSSEVQTESIDLLDEYAGTTKRIVFSWKNDSSVGNQPPAVVDNIRLVIGEANDTGEVENGVVNLDTEVTPDGGSPINPNVEISNIGGGGTVNLIAGYGESDLPNAGLNLTLSGVSFSGATITINHGLGFEPLQVAYKVLPGDWVLMTSASPEVESWDNAVVAFTLAAKADGDVEIVFPMDAESTLPVTLASFTAVLTADLHVNLAWVAESETDHAGYNILRSEVKELATAIMINPSLIDEGDVNGSQIHYSYTDTEVYHQATYFYWLESRSLTGESEYFGPLMVLVNAEGDEPEIPAIPTQTKLYAAFPNPFNPSTNLRYSMKDAGDVRIDVYNVKGQLMKSFTRSHSQAGYYQVSWDGRDLNGRVVGTGVYFYRMTSGKYSATKKMVLAK